MKTFDYAAAWREIARPAFLELPAAVLELLALTAAKTEGLHQARDLTQTWPDDGGELRRAFEAIDAEALTYAARVVYFTGHWWPSKGRGVELPGRGHGAHWKFSHLADQVTRARFGRPEADRDHGAGFSFAIIEGALRLCYTSRDMWIWREVAPATPAGLAFAEELRREGFAAISKHPERHRHERDGAAWEFFEAIKQRREGWPAYWLPWVETAERYMVEEGDQKPDPDEPPADVEAERRARIAAKVEATARKVRALERERDGVTWWMARDVSTENLIYYSHTDTFTFGWRHPVGPELLSRLLDLVSEFPYPYAIKAHDGKTYEGGQG